MDMEAMLLSLKSNVSSVNFEKKLMLDNFTIYDPKLCEGY